VKVAGYPQLLATDCVQSPVAFRRQCSSERFRLCHDFGLVLRDGLSHSIETPGFLEKPGVWVQAMASLRRAVTRRKLVFDGALEHRSNAIDSC